MEKKSNGLLICIIVILSILVLGLGGFIVYDKLLSDNGSSDNNSDNSNKKDDDNKQDNKNDNGKKIAQIIIDNNEIINDKVDVSKVSSKNGLYKENDNYFFRGSVTNNYLVMGTYNEDIYVYSNEVYDECLIEKKNIRYMQECFDKAKMKIASKGDDIVWRIVGINPDGTVKLILNGSTEPTPYNEDEYNSNSLESKNGVNYKNSTVKSTVDKWYDKNIKSEYDKYVVTGNYCNDTSGTIDDESGYDLYNPSLKCDDKYIINAKVGIISADEYVYSGVVPNTSSEKLINTYLTDTDLSAYWWTMTGDHVYAGLKMIFEVGPDGSITGDYITSPRNTNNPRVARPVINLANNLIVTGDGTKNNPYKINE